MRAQEFIVESLQQQVMYHGGPKPITQFRIPPYGLYFSPHREWAEDYGPIITKAHVDAKKVYVLDYNNEIDDEIVDALFDRDYPTVAKYIKQLQRQGFDAMQTVTDSEMLVVFPGTPVKIITNLNEIGYLPDITKANAEMEGQNLLGQSVDDLKGYNYKLLEKAGEHNIYVKQFTSVDQTNFVVTDQDNKVTAVMVTKPYGKALQATNISSSDDNTFKLPELYRRLIVNHKKTFVSDFLQSEGGKRVWEKISRLPGVVVFGWNHLTDEVINIDIEDAYVNLLDPDDLETHSDAQQILLVATKK